MYLIKYNNSGEIIWNKNIWPATADFYYVPGDVAIDSNDTLNVVVWIYFKNFRIVKCCIQWFIDAVGYIGES